MQNFLGSSKPPTMTAEPAGGPPPSIDSGGHERLSPGWNLVMLMPTTGAWMQMHCAWTCRQNKKRFLLGGMGGRGTGLFSKRWHLCKSWMLAGGPPPSGGGPGAPSGPSGFGPSGPSGPGTSGPDPSQPSGDGHEQGHGEGGAWLPSKVH